MPEIFESLNPIPSVVTTSGEELNSLATRARQRQQQILQNNPLSQQSSFGSQPTPGTATNPLGPDNPLAQPQGIPGVTNVNVGGQQRVPPSEQPSVDQVPSGPPTSAPLELESEPLDTGYTDLTPTQRNTAMRNQGMKVGDFATDPETGQARRSDTGALVLRIETDNGDGMFLAEDGIGAHAAMTKITRRLGIGAVPQDSQHGGDLGYTVAWSVPRGREQQFLAAVRQMKPDNVVLEGGRYHITFDAAHQVNRNFMRAPFGSSKPYTNQVK